MEKSTTPMDRTLVKEIVAARPEKISESNIYLKLLDTFDEASTTDTGYSVVLRGQTVTFEMQNLSFLEHPQVLHQWLNEYSPEAVVYIDVSDAREDLELYDELYEDEHPLKEAFLLQPESHEACKMMLASALFDQDHLERALIVFRLGREGGALVGQYNFIHSD